MSDITDYPEPRSRAVEQRQAERSILRGNAPSAESISLAVKLSGHNGCRLANKDERNGRICDGCLGDARTIDADLQLPQRNTALLLAQSVVDSSVPWSDGEVAHYPNDLLEPLRDALAAIKAKP